MAEGHGYPLVRVKEGNCRISVHPFSHRGELCSSNPVPVFSSHDDGAADGASRHRRVNDDGAFQGACRQRKGKKSQ